MEADVTRMKNILITGANFGNKGAQAMLFVTVSEIRSRYPDVKIYYTTRENLKISDGFKFTAVDKYTFINAFALKANAVNKYQFWKEAAKQTLRSLAKRNYRALGTDYKYTALIDSLDLVLDISGFNLSSLFSQRSNDYYLKVIAYSRKCGIPVILLPQSFGPFDYGRTSSPYIQNMREILQYPALIFAREQSGYHLLAGQQGLKNIFLSNDLVLQNRKMHWQSIFEAGSTPEPDAKIPAGNNVAIIPNRKIIEKCPHYDTFLLYRAIIYTLLQMEKRVYLIFHSSEDHFICKKIKENFAAESSVILLSQELNCYDFEHIITCFDYVIASRFHSIVHAFKNNVPCLGLGWAEKYRELFQSVGQQDYIIDMRADHSPEEFQTSLKKLNQNYLQEKKCIMKKLEIIQQNNCFDIMFEELEHQGIPL